MAHRLLAGADTRRLQGRDCGAVSARLRGAFALRGGAAEREEARQFVGDSTALFLSGPSLRYVGPVRRPNNAWPEGRAGPPYPREQSVLDEAVSARGPAGLTRALTLQEVLQILSKKSSGAAPA